MSDKIYSVYELNLIVKSLFKYNFKDVIKVEGEISNIKLTRNNLYVTLKDSVSKIDVVFWSYGLKKSALILDNGDKITVEGKLTVWDKQGSYQITANKIEKSGTGDLHEEFMKIKEKYNKAGYFDGDHKIKLADHIKNVGVITAIDGAALKDFLYVLEKNNFDGNVYVKGCMVQGKDCPTSVSKAIDELDKLKLDVIVITRGGGSYEDLFGFSHPKILDGIYNAKTCTISAIGHEVDTMLSDHVADIRAPTPSVAGEVIALHQQKKNNLIEIKKLCKEIHSQISKQLLEYQMMLQEYNYKIAIPSQMIDRCIYNMKDGIDIIKNDIYLSLQKYNSQLIDWKVRIKIMNPINTLKNGYCLLIDNEDGKSIKSVVDLSFLKDLSEENKKLNLKFYDGNVVINIASIEFNQNG